MTSKNPYSDNLAMLKTSNMQSGTIGNRFMIGIVAFGVSFGLSLVLSWDFNKAFLTGFITVPATYLAALFVDKRRKYHEMLVLDSLQRRIKELEGMKFHIVSEINQLEDHRAGLYAESNQLQNQVAERRNQRESLNRELSAFVGEKKQLEAEISYRQAEIHNLQKNQVELNNSFSALVAEKRRLELNCNISRAEIIQLQTRISELLKQRQELESNLTLLNRLKPQLEEKLYELRGEIQDLEVQENKQNKLILDKTSERKNIEASLNSLQTILTEQQTELKQLQEQVVLLQDERDQLQSQIWELLQQVETLNFSPIPDNTQENDNLFPFSDLIDYKESIDTLIEQQNNLPEEWTKLLEQLLGYEIQVLKAVLEQENPSYALKKIAEENITMPNLLIDSINERANNTIGELIIDPGSEPLKIYQEHLTNIKKIIAIYEDMMARQTSSN